MKHPPKIIFLTLLLLACDDTLPGREGGSEGESEESETSEEADPLEQLELLPCEPQTEPGLYLKLPLQELQLKSPLPMLKVDVSGLPDPWIEPCLTQQDTLLYAIVFEHYDLPRNEQGVILTLEIFAAFLVTEGEEEEEKDVGGTHLLPQDKVIYWPMWLGEPSSSPQPQ